MFNKPNTSLGSNFSAFIGQQPKLAIGSGALTARPSLQRSSAIEVKSEAIIPSKEAIEDDNVLHLGPSDWDRVLEESKNQTVIVDIWASWCHSCHEPSKAYLELAKKNRDKPITFVKFDIARDKEVSQRIGIGALPTFRIYKDGKEYGYTLRGGGSKIKSKLNDMVKSALKI